MELVVGQGCDARLPDTLPPSLGRLYLGGAGLVQHLEFRAGLVPAGTSRAERVVRYLRALQAADAPGRFYHSSLAADHVATASRLLDWRDLAIDHGWSGQPGAGSPGRLADLAAVEAHRGALGPCLAERVSALLPRLSLVAAAIRRITLLDAPADWPPPLQRLFTALAAAGIPLDLAPPVARTGAPATSDLGRLQRALDAQATLDLPLTLTGDGTLGLYHCQEPLGAAQALGEWLAGAEDPLLVVGADAFALGQAARARGRPDPALGAPSAWRPPLQLLPLLLQLAWSPPAADQVLQYLTLPTGPVRRLRQRLARDFTDLPGHDPAAWQTHLDAWVTAERAADPTRREDDLRAKGAAWLPIGAAGNETRMPRDLAITLADQVSHYWRSRLALATEAADGRVLAAAHQAAQALGAALRDWGEEAIGRDALHRLLDLAALAGATEPGQIHQVGSLPAVTDPAVARLLPRGPASLAWWDPRLDPEPVPPPFTPAEWAALPEAPDHHQREARTLARLQRALHPLITARQRALLVVRGPAGELVRLHLERRVPEAAWRSFEADLLAGTLPGLPATPLPDLPLPPAQRWWHLDRALPGQRARESYTSLAALALSPHAYVLEYLARLSRGAIKNLPVDARLLGNLAHRLIQDWFRAHPWPGQAPAPATISAWLETRLPAAIQTSALPLAAPGRRVERLAFGATLTTALTRLLGHLEAAGVVALQVESRLVTPLGADELEGTLDLLGRLADGRQVIVDLKWGGEKQRIAELEEGRYLQLAVYARLASGPGAPEVAFFILRSATLLATSQRCFPGARVVTPADPTLTPDAVWQRLRRTLDWRAAQLAAGLIEVTGNGAEATVDSAPPADALPLLEMEEAARKVTDRRRPRFKAIDTWRVLTGTLEP